MDEQTELVGLPTFSAIHTHDDFIIQALPHLQNLVWNLTVETDLLLDETLLLCVHMESLFWSDLVQALPRGELKDVNLIDSSNPNEVAMETRYTCLIVFDDICELLALKVPNLEELFQIKKQGTVRVIVLSDEGCSAYHLPPSALQ